MNLKIQSNDPMMGFRSPSGDDTLMPLLDVSKELATRLDSIPDSVPASQHRSFGLARAVARTLVDMLEDIAAIESGRGRVQADRLY